MDEDDYDEDLEDEDLEDYDEDLDEDEEYDDILDDEDEDEYVGHPGKTQKEKEDWYRYYAPDDIKKFYGY